MAVKATDRISPCCCHHAHVWVQTLQQGKKNGEKAPYFDDFAPLLITIFQLNFCPPILCNLWYWSPRNVFIASL